MKYVHTVYLNFQSLCLFELQYFLFLFYFHKTFTSVVLNKSVPWIVCVRKHLATKIWGPETWAYEQTKGEKKRERTPLVVLLPSSLSPCQLCRGGILSDMESLSTPPLMLEPALDIWFLGVHCELFLRQGWVAGTLGQKNTGLCLASSSRKHTLALYWRMSLHHPSSYISVKRPFWCVICPECGNILDEHFLPRRCGRHGFQPSAPLCVAAV